MMDEMLFTYTPDQGAEESQRLKTAKELAQRSLRVMRAIGGIPPLHSKVTLHIWDGKHLTNSDQTHDFKQFSSMLSFSANSLKESNYWLQQVTKYTYHNGVGTEMRHMHTEVLMVVDYSESGVGVNLLGNWYNLYGEQYNLSVLKRADELWDDDVFLRDIDALVVRAHPLFEDEDGNIELFEYLLTPLRATDDFVNTLYH